MKNQKNQKPETTKANETMNNETTNETKKAKKAIISTGNAAIDNALEHTGMNPEKTNYKKITENNNNLCAYLFIQLETELAVLNNQKAGYEKKLKKEDLTQSEIDVYTARLEDTNAKIAITQPIFDALKNENPVIIPEIAVYCYGAGASVLHLPKEMIETIYDNDVKQVLDNADKFFETVASLAGAKADSKKVSAYGVKNMKSNLQFAINRMGFATEYHINNKDTAIIACTMIDVNGNTDKNGNLTKESGLKKIKKETLLRKLCVIMEHKLVNRELAFARIAEENKTATEIPQADNTEQDTETK